MPTFPSPIRHSTGSASHGSQTRETEGIRTGRVEGNLSLFVNDVTLHIENPKSSTKKLLELINEFSEVAKYKINVQECVAFSHTNNRLWGK